ncbi:MAG: glucosamine-6-phosphate deaminase [Rhodospirillales bacterium]|nr:glucosamine-6-phosphate deaminase [Rhodospirillales bacterium]
MAEYKPVIIQTNSETEFADKAAQLLWEQLVELDEPLVTLPTGSTPAGLYQVLLERYGDQSNIWEQIRYLALDEYIGLPEDDRRLFQNWLARDILDPAGVPARRRITFNSMADNPAQEADAMEDWIAENGPIDIAVLGLGGNGHIAFNEPGCSFDSAARVITLAPETRQANAAYWGGLEHVPEQAYTLGLKTLARAKQILLLVSGAHKADILDRTLNGPISQDVPASFLRTMPNVTVIMDDAAKK